MIQLAWRFLMFQRVRDDTIRELVDKLKTCPAEAIHSRTSEESDRAVIGMTAIYDQLNKRIGEILRKLDDVEQVDFP